MEYACYLTTFPGQHGLFTLPVGNWQEGDLLYLQDQYALHLGTQLSCTIPKQLPHAPRSEILEPGLLSTHTLSWVHWFVAHRFTTYPKALSLRLGDELLPLLARKPKSTKKKSWLQATTDNFVTIDSSYTLQLSSQPYTQQVVVFPDVRTMMNTIPDTFKDLPHTLLLHSQSTPKQLQEAFRACKTWLATTIITTWSQIFHDRTHLSHCLVVAPHTRYYKQQQDPRYHTVTVLQELCTRLGIVLEMTEVEELREEK